MFQDFPVNCAKRQLIADFSSRYCFLHVPKKFGRTGFFAVFSENHSFRSFEYVEIQT
ncbi:hypothetical protein PANN_42850 [Pseudomonas aeruginosa C-NN2]|nr:hypothetical protein PANN_42850 [Pseudomonas aeruginosa C-NN2]